MTRWILLAASAVLLAACSPQKPAAPTYDTTLSVLELMEHVVDPQAKAFWGASGTVTTAEGEVDLSPTTEQGWAAAENAAAAVVEAGNLLMLPGRARDDGEWMTYSKQMSQVGLKAMRAAEAKDKQAMFDVGGELYEVCTACHEKYLPKPPE